MLCRTIEDAVRALGAGLIHDAVVVGDGRNLAGLVVEAAEGPLDDAKRQELAQEIVKRATEFNRGLFPHERIEDPERIIVVEKGSLPRTKVRRSSWLGSAITNPSLPMIGEGQYPVSALCF